MCVSTDATEASDPDAEVTDCWEMPGVGAGP